ncbi:MAG: hypothetical protein IPK19_25940 [Chloroflexi bacterium]|nr:hypothetical protein [Chloroflexota bacterium]
MSVDPNAPHFVLAAVKRIYPELPDLVGQENWAAIQPQIDTHITALESQPNNDLASTQLFGLLAQYEPARQRMIEEIQVQKVISANIAESLAKIAASLGIDPATTDGFDRRRLQPYDLGGRPGDDP